MVRFIQISILVLGSMPFLVGPSSAQDFSKVLVKSKQVSKSVFMITGQGGNIAVLTGHDGIIMVDDQFAPLHDKIKEAISRVSVLPIKFVVNTHWHRDHTGGNELLGKGGSVIVAHDNVRKRMSIENFNKTLKRKTPPAPKGALPVITFPDQMTFHLNNEQIKVLHFANAHTDGDSIIHFKNSNVIHTGDIFFNGFYPFIDVDSGGSIDGVIKAAEKILKIANNDTKIIPGHGPLGTKADLRNYLKMLKTVKIKMSKLVNSGKTLDQVVKALPYADMDEEWGKGFMKPDKFVTVVYRSISEKKIK